MRISDWSSDVCSSDLGRDDDVDHPLGAVETAPEIIVLTIGAAEEGAEAVELDALERRLGAALADRARVVGRDPIDLDRVELAEPVALQQRQRRDVVLESGRASCRERGCRDV